MIDNIYFGNDKSSISLKPENYKVWFTNPEIRMYDTDFSKILHQFSIYMQKHAQKVIKLPHKYKAEFYFKFFMITQMRKVPFSIYINFNYLEYQNNSGFNYIIKTHSSDRLIPFVENIVDYYISLLNDFLSYLQDKDIFNPAVVKAFNSLLLKKYQYSKEVAFTNLSVTADIKFKDKKSVNMFLDVITRTRLENYKTMTVDRETVFLYPMNKTIQTIDRNIPKIRFYDKQKDTIYRYYLKKRNQNHFLKIDMYEDTTYLERFELIDLHSQTLDSLESDFLQALHITNNIIRFEIDFGKKAIKPYFKENNLYKTYINNVSIISDFFFKTLNNENVSYSDTTTIWNKEQEKVQQKRYKYMNVFVDPLECTGDIADYLNIIVKNADFLNTILYNAHSKTQSLTDNAKYSKIKRFRQQGIIGGRGKNLVLNQPYRDLMSLYNYYTVIDNVTFLTTSQNNTEAPAKPVRRLR